MATANNEFFEALSALEKERGLPEDYLIDKIKAAIVIAVKKDYEVEDNGIGIPQDSQTRVFERFYRVDKSRSKATGGTGLGLAIVKHIALLHDAKIDLQSQVGTGTTIRVTFPKNS